MKQLSATHPKRGTLTLKVFNPDERTDDLAEKVVMVIPYESQSGSRIFVAYGQAIPAIKVNPESYLEGKVALATANLFYPEKIVPIHSKLDAQKQVDGYLALLRMTEGQPTSVALAEGEADLPISKRIELAFHMYNEQLAFESIDRVVEHAKRAAEIVASSAFDPDTRAGRRRILENASITAYFGAPIKALKGAASVTHPGRRPKVIAYR